MRREDDESSDGIRVPVWLVDISVDRSEGSDHWKSIVVVHRVGLHSLGVDRDTRFMLGSEEQEQEQEPQGDRALRPQSSSRHLERSDRRCLAAGRMEEQECQENQLNVDAVARMNPSFSLNVEVCGVHQSFGQEK
eukprot:427543-Hanusia_phi.AAC.3